MSLFAIAFVPGGNIAKQLGEIRASAFRSGGGADMYALPEAFYLGFYRFPPSGPIGGGPDVPDRKAAETALALSFRENAARLFEGLQPFLRFASYAFLKGAWYIVPEPPLSPAILAAADSIAAQAGLMPENPPPLIPGAGFFACGDVTPPPFEAFSFQRFAALLYRIEANNEKFDAAWWRVIARVPRPAAPRYNAPRHNAPRENGPRRADAK